MNHWARIPFFATRMARSAIRFGVAVALLFSGSLAWSQCGGTERWQVKVGTDPSAAQIDIDHPFIVQISDLIGLPALPVVAHGDNTTRRPEEMKVYTVTCHLVKFKLEGGTGDQDYHCVLSDDTLAYTGDPAKDGPGHSIVGEVVNPTCISGAHGNGPATSVWQQRLEAVRTAVDQRFQNIPASGGWVDANGIQVKVTGVAFFDRTHGQTGRTGDDATTFELHPILNIEFLDGPPPPPDPTVTASIDAPNSDLSIDSESAVSFAGSATDTTAGAVLSYAWDFGDGRSVAGAVANHTFTNPGNAPITYSVTFTAADNKGSIGVAKRKVTVNPSATPQPNTVYAKEPNDTMDQATVIPDDATQAAGYFQKGGDDEDFFVLTLPAGHTLTVDMTGPTDHQQDYDLFLFSSNGTQLTQSEGDGTSEHLSYKNTNTRRPKTLYLNVTRYKGYSATIPYSLTLSR